MKRILVFQINSIHQLINVLHTIKKELAKIKRVRLIILDSLPALTTKLKDPLITNGLLNQCANVMRFLASEFHLAVIVTNIYSIWYQGDFNEGQCRVETANCGQYWYNVPTTRLKMERGDESVTMTVMKSAFLLTNERCEFNLFR